MEAVSGGFCLLGGPERDDPYREILDAQAMRDRIARFGAGVVVEVRRSLRAQPGA